MRRHKLKKLLQLKEKGHKVLFVDLPLHTPDVLPLMLMHTKLNDLMLLPIRRQDHTLPSLMHTGLMLLHLIFPTLHLLIITSRTQYFWIHL